MQALFINGSTGKLFAIYWPPNCETALGKAIIHIPAFAEEINRSRSMVALQARAFAEQGYAVLVLDLFGTGDSAGDFGEATWDIWLQNINAGIDWLKGQHVSSIYLWGLRIGALLAMDFVNRGLHPIERLIAWQPVLKGDTFITQFLRLRVAAAMMDNDAPQEKTSDLKRHILAGQFIEVAGYWLNPNLIKPLIALCADRFNWLAVKDVAIFEVVSSEDSPATLGNTELLTIFQKENINASLTKVIGEAFWANHGSNGAPDLIKTTCETIGQWR